MLPPLEENSALRVVILHSLLSLITDIHSLTPWICLPYICYINKIIQYGFFGGLASLILHTLLMSTYTVPCNSTSFILISMYSIHFIWDIEASFPPFLPGDSTHASQPGVRSSLDLDSWLSTRFLLLILIHEILFSEDFWSRWGQ